MSKKEQTRPTSLELTWLPDRLPAGWDIAGPYENGLHYACKTTGLHVLASSSMMADSRAWVQISVGHELRSPRLHELADIKEWIGLADKPVFRFIPSRIGVERERKEGHGYSVNLYYCPLLWLPQAALVVS